MGARHQVHRPWTPDEDQFVQATMRDPEEVVAEILGRTIYSIRARRATINTPSRAAFTNEFNLARNDLSRKDADHNRDRWSEEEDQFVLDTLDELLPDVASALGRTIFAVAGRRFKLRDGGQGG